MHPDRDLAERTGRDPFRTLLLLTAAWALTRCAVVVVGRARGLYPFQDDTFDVGGFAAWGAVFAGGEGAAPLRDGPWEYPLGAVPVVLAPALLKGAPYVLGFVGQMALWDAALLLVLALVGVAVGWRPHLGALLPAVGITVLATAAYTGLALLLASVLRPEATTGLATLIYVLMLAAGGIMFAAPDLGTAGWFLLPLAAHAEALRATLTAGTGVPGAIWASLALWATVSLTAASRLFKWE